MELHGASDSGNIYIDIKTFKRRAVDTSEFTYAELVVWLKILSKIGKCRGRAVCRGIYANTHRGRAIKGGCGYVKQRNSGAI